MMTLLGLHRFVNRQGGKHPFDTEAIFQGLIKSVGWIRNLGDLGLLLWTCAETAPEALPELCSRLDLHNALDRFADGRARRTMELAWLLTGLAEARLACPALEELTGVAEDVYRVLHQNQWKHGFFGHSSRSASLAGKVRGRYGSFADQVYPIVALTAASRAFGWATALGRAKACGEAILRAQGQLGQWWWHYDCVTGAVVERYPVYSVHQDAMAPMALFALEDAGVLEARPAIVRGLQWIGGSNELGVDMRRITDGLVWRSLYHRRHFGSMLRKFSVVLGSIADERTDDLVVCREDRPYHFGWVLYAFSGRI